MVIFAAVLSSVVWSYTSGPSETWQVLLETRLGRNSDELRELLARLETEKIPWQLNQGTDGRKFEIKVHSGADYKKALLLASENGLVDGEGETESQGFFGGGLTDTPEKARLRMEQAKIRKVEKAIRWNPAIAFVDLVIKHGKAGRFATDKDTPDTAVVLLRMEDSAARLATREAGTIRKLVSSAFAIESERIQVIDSNMRDYPGGSEGLAQVLARDLRAEVQKDIAEVIAGLYLGVFTKEQFRLGVIVDDITAGTPKAVEPVTAAGAEEPGVIVGPGVAGGATGASGPEATRPKLKYCGTVSLVLDIGAVKDVLARRDQLLASGEGPVATDDFAGRIKAFEREQEEFLARQLPLDNARVTVKTEAFFRPQAAEAASSAFFASLFEGNWELNWLSDSYIYGGGAFALTLLVFCLYRVRVRRKKNNEARAGDAFRTDACRETLQAVEKAGKLARNSPDISTSVVEMWLSESLDPVVEMSNPAGAGAEG